MLVEHHREKLINAVIYFLKHTKYCGKTKLVKLLYFLDFLHFKGTGRSVTNLDYYAWDFGPVPQDFYCELELPPPDLEHAIYIQKADDRSFVSLKPKGKFDKKYFSKREMQILEKVSFIFKEARADDMVEVAHLLNEPWDRTIKTLGKRSRIDYLLALDNSAESLSKEEAIERLQEYEEMKRIFNG